MHDLALLNVLGIRIVIAAEHHHEGLVAQISPATAILARLIEKYCRA